MPVALSKADRERAAARLDALPPDPAGIPDALAARPQWVAWDYVRRSGRWTKLPIDPASRRPAKSNDPGTWNSLPSALAVPNVAGVGFMFHADDPFCGIDLDDCRDPETGSLTAECQRIVDAFNSYVEVSPSGTGVKLFIKGTLPNGAGRKCGHIEIYDRGRYFAVTGRPAFRPVRKIRNAQKELDHLAASLATRESRVTSDAAKSPSEGDLAFCVRLVQSLGDRATPEAIDKLFRASGRMRPKWDERRGELTYGQRTIARALEVAGDPRIVRTLEVIWAHELDAKPLDWLWHPWLARGILAVLDGDPGLGKSSITLDLIGRATTGRPMPGCETGAMPTALRGHDNSNMPTQSGGHATQLPPLTAMIVVCEDSLERVVKPRLEAAQADLSKVALLGGVIESGPDGELTCPLQLPRDLDLIAEECRKMKPALLVIDPLFAVIGLDSRGRMVKANDDQSIRKLTGALAALAEETGTVVLAVRHLNKSAGGSALMRGSGSIAIAGQARAVLLAAKDPANPQTSRILAMTKSNLGPLPRSRAFTLAAAPTSCGPTARVQWGEECDLTADDLVKPPDPKSERIVEVRDRAQEFLKAALADGPLSWESLTDGGQAAGFTAGTLRKARSELRLMKEYRGKNKCLWRLPEPGELGELPGLD